MLRRLATLSVLLLSLSGVIPMALACAPGVQTACCADLPHNSTSGSAPLLYNDGPCCVSVVGSESIAVAVSAAEPRVTNLPSPDEPSVLPSSADPLFELASDRTTAFNTVSRSDRHQQQVYLLTGRLRL